MSHMTALDIREKQSAVLSATPFLCCNLHTSLIVMYSVQILYGICVIIGVSIGICLIVEANWGIKILLVVGTLLIPLWNWVTYAFTVSYFTCNKSASCDLSMTLYSMFRHGIADMLIAFLYGILIMINIIIPPSTYHDPISWAFIAVPSIMFVLGASTAYVSYRGYIVLSSAEADNNQQPDIP